MSDDGDDDGGLVRWMEASLTVTGGASLVYDACPIPSQYGDDCDVFVVDHDYDCC